MLKKATDEPLAQSKFALPASGGVRFEKPRNKNWILSPQQRRAGWRRRIMRGLVCLLLLATLPIGLEYVGVLPAGMTKDACAQLGGTRLASFAPVCDAPVQLAFGH
jgi:hypothetical protein